MLMGYIGDKVGRKTALEISIFLMAVPTFAMGCLPTYSQVGWLSTVLLVLVRLLQGLSVGGQLMSSLVYTLEPQPYQNWGYCGSLVMMAANLGTLLGGIVGFVMRKKLSEAQLLAWGWRIPFLAGIFVSVVGIYLRYQCDEITAEGGNTSSTQAPPNPIRTAFSRGNRRALIAASLVPMVWSSGFYTTFVWMAIYMKTLLEPPIPHAFFVNSLALFLSVCVLFPFVGRLSDIIGRKFTMTIGGSVFAVVSPFMVWGIGAGHSSLVAFVCQCIMGVTLSFWGAPMMAWLVESFSPEARLTSVAIGYNIAQATIGGLAPFLATLLNRWMGGSAPGFMLSVVSILGVIGLRCIAPHDREGLPLGAPGNDHPPANGGVGTGTGTATARNRDDDNANQNLELVTTGKEVI